MIKPQYDGNSIVNLISSILHSKNIKNNYPCLNDYKIPEYKNLVFIVVDGMGHSFISENGKNSFLSEKIKLKITSVFPSTTSSALTSLMTGVAPLQHAMTGWFMYFKELACASVAMPFVSRYSGEPFDKNLVSINDCLNFETIFNLINDNIVIISPESTINSAFSNYCYGNKKKIVYKSIKDCFDRISEQLQNDNLNKLIFAYIPNLDESAHMYGINSSKTIDIFNEIDSLCDSISKNNKDSETLFIITADHGLIDTEPDRILNIHDFPKIEECLTLPLCGEPRVPYCYVRSAKVKQFLSEVEDNLSSYCNVLSFEESLKDNIFGYGLPNSKFFERIGDYILVMKKNYVFLDKVYKENPKRYIGYHGGSSEEEIFVPLIEFGCE